MKSMNWETVSLCFPTPAKARRAHDILERVVQKTHTISALGKSPRNLREYTEDMIELVEHYQALSVTTRTPETVLGVPSSEVGSKAVTLGSCNPRRESFRGLSTTMIKEEKT